MKANAGGLFFFFWGGGCKGYVGPPLKLLGALATPSSYAFETEFPNFVGVLLALKGSNCSEPGPEVLKLFSCSTQLSMNFFLLINVKMPTIVGIVTFMSGKNSILGLSEPKRAKFRDIFILMSI